MTSSQNAADLGSSRDLEERLVLTPPGDTARGYFFSCALEQVRLHGDEKALKRCLEVSGQDAFTAFFSYPISSLLRLLFCSAWSLKAPTEGFEDSLRHLGRHVARHFRTNSVGRAMLVLAARSPKRLADSLTATYPTGWGHGKGSVKWAGPQQCIAYIHGNVIPYPYFEGIFLELFEAAGATDLKVKGRQVRLADTEYEISWG
ncbi:TIGR02265 family protein [Archangium violaceum]|uniref:TIGR02265 family protein n=1 Tax=Archangium violaceum TaxID=83451 RepID=UPI0037C19C2C